MLLALVATSLATLSVAGLVVLPPLERRLERDRLNELHALALTIRPAIRNVPIRERRPGASALLRVLAQLQARTGGRLILYDRHGVELADTEPTPLASGISVGNPLSLRSAALRQPGGVFVAERGDAALAATVAGRPDALVLVIVKPLDDSRAAAAVVRSAIPLALAAGMAVAVALAFVLSGSLLRRLDRLRADARALASEGLGHRIRVSGTDEVAVVAGALEDVRERLVEEQLSRQEFIATASHELRTPLASLQASLEVLQEESRRGTLAPATVADRTDLALRQTRRLTALATDLLDLSRIDGGAPLRSEPLELGELVSTIGAEFSARLQGAGRTLRVSGSTALAEADPAAMARITRILLDNALKYGAGPVDVDLTSSAKHVMLSVSDAGPGIPAEDRERIFRRFTRSSEEPGGAGLGLAIARGLAAAMGGVLVAEPAPRGARFVLTLPAA